MFGNPRFRNNFYSHIPKLPPINLDGIKTACVHDVLVKNINVYYDEKITKVDKKYNVPIVVESVLENVEFYNIKISDIKINGQKLLKQDALIHTDRVKNLQFE